MKQNNVLNSFARALMTLLVALLTSVSAWADYTEEELSTPLTLEFINSGNVTISNPLSLTIKYSINNGEKQTVGGNTDDITINVSAGQTVQLYGNGTTNATYGKGSSGVSTVISCDADCYVYGNIMSLVDETGFATNTSLTAERTFTYLFYNNTHLKNHSSNELVLPATTLAEYCYLRMFSGCTGLTAAPALPATTLATFCYGNMFSGCTGLTTAPNLPATTLAVSCYSNMFNGCTGLTTAPDLPATSLADGCYNGMFNGTNVLPDCSNIDFKNENVVASGGLKGLFAGTAVSDAQLQAILTASGINEYSLPATELANYCYESMFSGCTGLTTAPALPATTLAEECYANMFQDCSRLTTAPDLPATTLAELCYSGMFSGCTKLTTAPDLPATTLAVSCYEFMFYGCKGLTTAPDLPATTLADYCYFSMFYGCKGLTTAPDLPATTLTRNCYSSMFYGCTNLNYVKCLAPTNLSDNDCTTNWLSGVAETGTFVKAAGASWGNGASGIPSGWSTVNFDSSKSNNTYTIKYDNNGGSGEMSDQTFTYYGPQKLTANTFTRSGYTFVGWSTTTNGTVVYSDQQNVACLTETNGATITLYAQWVDIKTIPLTLDFSATTTTDEITVTISNPLSLTIKYSTDGGTKTESKTNPITINVSAGQTVQLYGNGTTNATYGKGSSGGSTEISCDADCYVYGNIMSLVDETGFATNTSLTAEKTFTYLFYNNTHLKNHSSNELVLPATTLAEYCYLRMFSGCTGLTAAPALPATTLATFCYGNMFNGCTALTTAPELPATTMAEYCYQNMFENCTGLTTAPALPATTLADGCYYCMFSGTNVLPDCSNIDFKSATVVASGGLQGLFAGTAVSDAQLQAILTASGINEYSLPVTELANYCYESMFSGCTGLTTAPALPATSLAEECYGNMFGWCTGLTTAPALPATTLAKNCYSGMFNGCTKLTTAPALPATTLAVSCYKSMFYGCTKLTTAPALPATTLADYCYFSMFFDCISLTTAPDLPATTLAKNCYRSMFSGCTKLNYVKCLATTNLSANDCTTDWLKGVAETGTFVKAAGASWGSGVSGIPSGWSVYPHVKYTVQFDANNDSGETMASQTFYCGDAQNLSANTFTAPTDKTFAGWNTKADGSGDSYSDQESILAMTTEENATIILYAQWVEEKYTVPLTLEFPSTGSGGTVTISNPLSLTIKYSINNGEKQTVGGNTDDITINVSEGQTVQLYGTNASYGDEENQTNIYCSDECYIDGNIMSLVDETGFAGKTKLTRIYAFSNLFSGNEYLKNHTDATKTLLLPATTLAANCYSYMFSGCSALTKAPELPATTLAANCYEGMFMSSGLTEAPTLPATTLAANCYSYMFSYCSALTEAPALSSETLAESCYMGMFQGCTALTEAPTLPATTLAASCYASMFMSSGLTSAPALPAKTLAANCYEGMFQGCADLNAAPTISATTLAEGCYSYMFAESGLTSAPELTVETLAEGCYEFMFSECTSLTSVPTTLPASVLARNCYNNMFYGCTALETAPALSATTLAESCYNNMFYGCTKLKTAPALSATTLAANCYKGMFQNSGLTEAPTLSAETLAEGCYSYMFLGCTSLASAPALSSKTLAESCYMGMFQGCTALTEAPTLSATTLAANCYNYMFAQSGLTTAPALPAETLAADCYEGMFYGCTNLTTAPELPAKTLVESCYDGMFYGCSNLNYIKMLATKITATACLDNWVDGVAATGTFVKDPRTAISEGISGIPSGWTTENTPLYLANNASNSTDINSANGQTCDVVLSDRTLYKDEDWNTLCLPFDVTISGSVLSGATAMELTEASFSAGTLTLNFTAVTALEAGKPYIIKWDDPNNELDDIANPTFDGVTISNGLVPAAFAGVVTFTGNYDSQSFAADNNSILLMGGSNTLYYPQNGASIGAFRAYFQLADGITAGDTGNGVHSFVLNFGDETTGINGLTTEPSSKGEWSGYYNLNGQRLSKPQRGLNIINGKKVVVK